MEAMRAKAPGAEAQEREPERPGGGAHGRSMRADALKNRRRILEAAEEVFAAEGVGVPIDTVAERAGVGVGTVYRHFPTKEALFEAIVVTRLQELVSEAASCFEAGDAGEAFFVWLRQFARQASKKQDLFDALVRAGIDIKSQCADLFEQLEAAIDRLVEQARRQGTVRSDVATKDVIGLVLGACQAARQRGLGLPPSYEHMVDVVCDGLRLRT
jgi:AcrR family transcriptional regulator